MAQGLPLTRLRHRWAAMNPPPGDHSAAADGVSYDGAEPLDVALADRFSFVLEVPVLGQLGDEDRRAVLLGGGRPQPDASDKLRGAVERCRALLAEAQDRLRGRAAEYVDVLAAKLAARRPPALDPARGDPRPQRRVALGGAAGCSAEASRRRGDLEDAFYGAARFSLPDAAWGRPVEGHVILAAHRAAWEAARLAADSPHRALLVETNPLRRIALALQLDLPPGEAGAVIADGFSALPRPARLVTSAVLFPRLAVAARSPGQHPRGRGRRVRRRRRGAAARP